MRRSRSLLSADQTSSILYIDFERGNAARKFEPGQFAPGVDVNVGRYRLGLVQRSGANEQGVAGCAMIAAPYVSAALATKKHLVISPAACFEQKRLWNCATWPHELFLDPDVDHKRAPADALAIPAVTGMYNERTGGQLIPQSCA